ncbi:MAG: DUF6261 family protein [Tannerella sp.]|nr:DUF6261 family protein [Tannerella sp.]
MKITRTDFHLYRNEQWFQFYTEFKRLAEIYPDLNIGELLTLFLVVYDKADVALEILRRSDKTELIGGADGKRDHTFRGFADAVKSYLNHFNPEKRQAGVQLEIVFNHYGNVNRLPNDEETAAIYNLLQDVKTTHAPQIELLGLGEWVEELERDNLIFQALTEERNAEEATRSSLRMIEVRREGDAIYHQIVERLEALMVVNGDEAYTGFVHELNNLIKHYNNILASRKGRAKENEE